MVNSYSFNPSPLTEIRGDPMIASFWADADLRGSGTVYYRESCNGSELLRAADLINDKYGEFSEPTSVVVVTWENVGYFKNHTDKVQPYWQQSSTITLVQLTKQWNIHLFTQYKNIHLFVVYIHCSPFTFHSTAKYSSDRNSCRLWYSCAVLCHLPLQEYPVDYRWQLWW